MISLGILNRRFLGKLRRSGVGLQHRRYLGNYRTAVTVLQERRYMGALILILKSIWPLLFLSM